MASPPPASTQEFAENIVIVGKLSQILIHGLKPPFLVDQKTYLESITELVGILRDCPNARLQRIKEIIGCDCEASENLVNVKNYLSYMRHCLIQEVLDSHTEASRHLQKILSSFGE